MAYTDTDRSRNRSATIVVVAALHVAAGYALVNGLASSAIPFIEERIIGEFIIEDKPKPPPPAQKPTEKAAPDNSHVTVTDRPFVIPTAAPTFAASNDKDKPSAGDDIGTVLYPVATPTPEPLPPPPLFTPRTARPRGDTGGWVTTNDYPTRDIREGNEGTTGFRLAIGTDGRVTGCTVTRSSGHPGLDAATCSKMSARGRFEPASDETGAKVAGSWAYTVKWQLPKE